MWSLFRGTKELAVSFCGLFGRICDAGWRRAAFRERVMLQQLWLAVRG
jgi:hypothetical protein